MNEFTLSHIPLPQFSLWENMRNKNSLFSFDFELTARCNLDCRHCYINLPASDKMAREKELSIEEIKEITDEAISLGAFWCLLTGGEPLLRKDFFDIYLYLKRKGLLVSVFTNATLVTEKHVGLFKEYPPRDVEVTVYGVTRETYEKVTRKSGSFNAFITGLNLLSDNGVKVRLKAMALRSNISEMHEIAHFCREKTKDYFRFDPFLHLRLDGNPSRNKEIKSERLYPEEVIELERSDPDRFEALEKGCDKLIISESPHKDCNHLFHCGAGNGSFTVSYDGLFRLCSSLCHPDCVDDLRERNLTDSWQYFIPRVRKMQSSSKEYLEKCHICTLINLCMWCPAHAHLETGELDSHVGFFCELAHTRAKALGQENDQNQKRV